ncbi:MAG: hypothetical protein WCE90_09105 [Candidatus Zixiibacteriota bacterium]
MRRLLISMKVFIEEQGLSLFTTLSTAALIILLTIMGWFQPNVYEFIRKTHLFESIVLLILIEIVIVTVRKGKKKESFQVFTEESDAQARIFKLIETKQIERARILSAGLGSRRLLISRLAGDGIDVEVLAQDPDTAIDKRDAQQTIELIHLIKGDIGSEMLSHLHLLFHRNVSSLRAVILYEVRSRIKHLFLGWYAYYDNNSIIRGSHHPTIYVSTKNQEGRKLSKWIESMIDEEKKDGRRVPSNT